MRVTGKSYLLSNYCSTNLYLTKILPFVTEWTGFQFVFIFGSYSVMWFKNPKLHLFERFCDLGKCARQNETGNSTVSESIIVM